VRLQHSARAAPVLRRRRLRPNGRNYRKAGNLDRVWVADGFNFTGYDAVVVTPVATQNIKPKDDKEADRLSLAQGALERDFMLMMQARKIFPAVVTKESEIKPGSKALKLENTIVKFSRGSSALRFGVGFGAGMPYIRLQGQLSELGSSKPLFIYDIDETGDWFASGYISSGTIQSQAASELVEDVVNFMVRTAKGETVR
jgi:hypothetical protein